MGNLFSCTSNNTILDKFINKKELTTDQMYSFMLNLEKYASVNKSRYKDIIKLICHIYLSHDYVELLELKKTIDVSSSTYDNEYIIFNYIKDDIMKATLLRHISQNSIKYNTMLHIVSDIDDTLYPSTIGGSDESMIGDNTNNLFYPGVHMFHKLVPSTGYSTLLSARPQAMEQHTRDSFKQLYNNNKFVKVNIMSGKLDSLVNMGIFNDTMSSILDLNIFVDPPMTIYNIEDTYWFQTYKLMGLYKYQMFKRYVNIYPEYQYIFIGDAGQGDIITAINIAHNCDNVMMFIYNIYRTGRRIIGNQLINDLRSLNIFVFNNYIDIVLILLDRNIISNNTAVLIVNDVNDNVDILHNMINNTIITDYNKSLLDWKRWCYK